MLMPVIVPYLAEKGISPGQVVTLQAIYGFGVMLFEVPTGYLCDRVGRRQSLALGGVLNLLGFALLPQVHGFAALAAIELVLASGWSLVSGADIALIYDLLDQQGADRQQRRDTLANYQLAQVLGEATAAILGGLLASRSLALVGWTNAAFALTPLAIVLALRPTPVLARPHASPLADLGAATRLILRTRRRRLVFLNMTVWGLSTFAAVWLLQPYWSLRGVPIGWFGLLWAGTLATVGVVAKSARWLERGVGAQGVLLILALCPPLGYLGMAGLDGAPGVACGFLFYVSRGLNSVHLREAFNHELPARLRATCNSLASGSFRLVFAVCGPVIGAVVDQAGLLAALTGLGVVFLLAVLLVAYPLWRES